LPPSSRVKPTIAVTVRLDEARYERLKRFGSQHRITNQDIIVAALDHFLQGRE
jgi:predicted transcriptional regulator